MKTDWTKNSEIISFFVGTHDKVKWDENIAVVYFCFNFIDILYVLGQKACNYAKYTGRLSLIWIDMKPTLISFVITIYYSDLTWSKSLNWGKNIYK